ncbi:MAG: hypothetical protein WDN69_18010 [Aliidongia sp.]
MTDAPPAAAASPKIVMTSERIPSGDPGIELYMREKHPAGMTHFDASHTLLFVHGATYPAETSFDLPLDGVSMMDWLAARGFDVWLVDIRGYGLSTRPPEMDQPPEANPPLVDTATASHDVGMAVEHILAKRHLQKLDLMGWSGAPRSWGSTPPSMTTRSTGCALRAAMGARSAAAGAVRHARCVSAGDARGDQGEMG